MPPNCFFLFLTLKPEVYSSRKTIIAKSGLIKFYCVWPTVFKYNLVHLTILPGNTGEFQKSRKILKNATF